MFTARRVACALVVLSAAACEKPKPVAPVLPLAATPRTRPMPTTRTETQPTTKMPPASELAELAKGSNELGFDLYARLRSAPGNLALSPASISAALAMTYGGANAETAAQMKKTLHFTGDGSAVMAAWGNLTKALTDSSRPMKLRIANRLFGEKTTKFEQPYLYKTMAAFGAPLEPVDFKTGFEAARGHINGWVEAQTEQRIRDLLPASALDGLTRLVLVNAIYFLADWEEPFEQERTRPEKFQLTATKTKSVPTMKNTSHFPLAKGAGVRVLELPYKGNAVAMWVVLPDKVDGLADVEKSLSSASLASWRGAFTTENVNVELPRFEVNPPESLSLAKELQALGMPMAFERETADFTLLANPADPRERLHISSVFHKAFVKTDEKGTEAAAATAVVMAEGSGMPMKPVDFKVDRPFLFFIVDKPSNLVLFMGRVSEP